MKLKKLMIVLTFAWAIFPFVIQSRYFDCHQLVADSLEERTHLLKAESLLGRELPPKQARAILNSHFVGLGEMGKDGTPARIGNYTYTQMREKILILRDDGFPLSERRILVENKIVGISDDILDAMGIVTERHANRRRRKLPDLIEITFASAAKEGKTDLVRSFLKSGADPNRREGLFGLFGDTPLISAVLFERIETIKELLKAKSIDVNRTNELGSTPLMIAASKSRIEGLRELLKVENIDVNRTDKKGNTALIFAARFGRIEAVKELLKAKNINVHHANNDGLTALTTNRTNPAIRALLLKAGAEEY